MGSGAVARAVDPEDETAHSIDPTLFHARLIEVHRSDSVTRKSNTDRVRPPLISYVQLSKLEKNTLREIALDEETDALTELITKQCTCDCYSDEKLYFYIGEWDSHETLIHCIIGSKKNKNLRCMLRLVLTHHYEHFEQLMNLQTSDGETPLITAVMNSSIECLNTLLCSGGVDIELKDDREMTAENHAYKEKELEMMELIRSMKPTCRKINRYYVLNPTEIDPKLLKRRSILMAGQSNPRATDSLLQDLLKHYPAGFSVRGHESNVTEVVKANKFFVDEQFPAEAKTLCDPKDVEASQVPFLSNIVWLRPYQIFNGKDYKLYEDHISPEDVIQGKPKTCFYLAVFASLALHPYRVRSMILNTDVNPYGYYVVRLYINGKQKDVVIDDQFPCMNSNRKAAFCQPNGSELWVMLLEKAWVKSFGFYSKVQSVLPEDIIEDLLGVPSYGYTIPRLTLTKDNKTVYPEATFNRIRYALNNGYVVVAVSGNEVVKDGISPCQSYSVLQAVEISPTVRLIKLRNSIDSVEWNGEYGDSKITPSLAAQLNYESKRDGIFWATFREFLEIFVYYSVGYCRDGCYYSQAEFDQPDSTKNGRNIYYRFSLNRRQKVNIRLIQSYSKYLQEKNYLESPAILTTMKLNNKGTPKIIASGCPRSQTGHKSIHFDLGIFKDLDEGDYLIQVRVKWRQSTNPVKRQAVVGVYCEEQNLPLTRVDSHEGDRYLLSAYFQEAIAKGRAYRFSQGYIVYEYLFKDHRKIYAVDSPQYDGSVVLEFRAAEFENCQVDFGRIESDQLKMRVNYRSVGTIYRKEPNKQMKAVLIS